MLINLTDDKVILLNKWKTTSLPAEFVLALHLFSRVVSFPRSIISTRKWKNICECLLSGLPHDPDPTQPPHSPLPVWTFRVGEAEQRPRVQGEDRVQSPAQRGGERPKQYLCFPLSVASPPCSSPSPVREADCRLPDGKDPRPSSSTSLFLLDFTLFFNVGKKAQRGEGAFPRSHSQLVEPGLKFRPQVPLLS